FGAHLTAQTQSNPSVTSADLSAAKISLQLPKINVCLLQIGLAEDNVQLTELRTSVDIVTMSLFALSSGVFKIQSITGQFCRFEIVNIHAIQSQRCRLQFRLPNHIQTHLPLGNNKKNVGFVMNEFGLQRLCFKLINNAAKQREQQRIHILTIMTQIDETQTTRASSKHKSKRKQSTDPLLASPSAINSPINILLVTTTTNSSVAPVSSSPSSSSVFDGSIDHVWISFPEPPHHTHSTSNSSKRQRTSTTSAKQTTAPKKLFSYTRYGWNFLSTISPTVLEKFLHKRKKRFDAILAYFLIKTKSVSTLSQSKLYELLTPKTKYLLSHPACQLVFVSNLIIILKLI
ncbi:unnamed protein product, partial [Adineta steineri]